MQHGRIQVVRALLQQAPGRLGVGLVQFAPVVAGLVLSTAPVQTGPIRLADDAAPIGGSPFYVDPNSAAMRASKANPDSPELAYIANTPQAYFIDNLSDEHQQIVREAGKATAVAAWEDYKDSIDADREFLRSAGVTVTPMTDEDRAKMIEKTTPLVNKLLADNDWAPELAAKIADVK